MHPRIVDRTAFLLFASRAEVRVHVDRRLVILAVAHILRRRPRTRPIAWIGLRTIGYQFGAVRVRLRASGRPDRDRRQANRRKSQTRDNSGVRCHAIIFLPEALVNDFSRSPQN
jgi:hypothetical protein